MRNKQQKGTILIYLLIALAIVVAILVVLLTGQRQPSQPQPTPVVDSQVEKLQQLSPSDEVPAIEKDLQNTNFDQIDSELTEVDKTLPSL